MKLFSFVAILLLASLALAQPQAPIAWGEARQLETCPQPYVIGELFAKGDTLVRMAVYPAGPSSTYPVLSVTGDNGQTWGDWHLLGQLGEPEHTAGVTVKFTDSELLCAAETGTGGYESGIYRTSDLGQTWQGPGVTSYHLAMLCQREDTIFCRGQGSDSVSWTADAGQTFAPWREAVDSGWTWSQSYVQSLSTTPSYLHMVTCGAPDGHLWLYYARAGLLEGSFEPVQVLNDQFYRTSKASVQFRSAGTGMILSAVNFLSIGFYNAICLNISRDRGDSWSEPITLSHGESSDVGRFGLCNFGTWWLTYWVDTTRAPGFDYDGVWYCFSANDGRSWYPSYQLEGVDIFVGFPQGAELSLGQARFYLTTNRYYGQDGNYYLQWEGQIHVDTLLPVVTPLSLPADTVEVNSQQLFLASITDNDTLSREELIIREGDSITAIPMEWTSTDYMAHWTVPHEGRFFYRIEGEDFWENVGSYPDSGWAMLVTPGWVDEADDRAHAVRHYNLISVFPNPANGPVMLSLSPDWFRSGAVEIAVFNLLGETVSKQQAFSASGTIRLANDRLTSGLYFLHVSNSRHSALQKLLILK